MLGKPGHRMNGTTAAGAGAWLAAFLLGASPACQADEPAGSITIIRDIPARNAFRPGPPGAAYKVATAREDVVIANARALESTVASLPLRSQDHAVSAGTGVPGTAVPAAMSGAALDASVARLPATGIGNATHALSIGAAVNPMGSLAGGIGAVMRGR